MEIKRVIRIRLDPDRAATDLLLRTVEACTWSFNRVAEYGWTHGVANGVELHHATYYPHREQTKLPSQLVCQARVKAAEALKSVKAKLKKGQKATCPKSSFMAIRYDARSYGVSFERNEVSLLTLEGRVKMPFMLTDYYREYSTWDTASADLIRDRKGRWWLHVVMTTEIEDTIPNGEAVGIDLGIVHPATDSRGIHYGSDYWKVVEDRLFQLRRALQAKGTKSAKRHLRKLSGRRKRFRRDCDHVLSKQLIRSVQPGTTLVFEDLTDIRSGSRKLGRVARRRVHGWSFAQLQAFTEYKADRLGVHLAYVDPCYTSQTCAECGHREKQNRPSQAVFSCLSCGHESNADVNAALNIRAKHLDSPGLTVNQPIVSTLATA